MERQVSAHVSWTSAVAVVAMLVLAPRVTAAQVGPTGFVVRHSVTIAAPADRVYDTLTRQIGSWWNPDHTHSGDARNLSIDPKPGGCFCEALPNGGGVEHARVIYLAPRSLVRLSGALGPLQASGATGTLTWSLASTTEGSTAGTTVQMTYSVGGFIGGPFDAIAPLVQSVLAEQLDRMKRFIETGKPAAPPAANREP